MLLIYENMFQKPPTSNMHTFPCHLYDPLCSTKCQFPTVPFYWTWRWWLCYSFSFQCGLLVFFATHVRNSLIYYPLHLQGKFWKCFRKGHKKNNLISRGFSNKEGKQLHLKQVKIKVITDTQRSKQVCCVTKFV